VIVAEETGKDTSFVFVMYFDSLLGRSINVGIDVLEKRRTGAHGFVHVRFR